MDAADTPLRQQVLVTGGTGFVASWVIITLLNRGYAVRTTVRSLDRADDVRRAVLPHVDGDADLSFVQADLLHDHGWADAAAGIDYVIHTASPMPMGEFRKQDLIRPAREGMRRVLTAGADAGVKRAVITSSTDAAIPAPGEGVADETTWSNLPDRRAYNYSLSKTRAERDAWKMAETMPMEIVSILPSSVQGPVLSSDYSPSVEVLRMILAGKMPALPNFGWNFVDVRDLAELHVRAMTVPEAAGQRFLASVEFLWMHEVAALLKRRLGEDAAKVSLRRLPDVVVRLGALVNPEMAQIKTILRQQIRLDTTKARTVLDWHPRPAEVAIIDAARSLVERRLVRS